MLVPRRVNRARYVCFMAAIVVVMRKASLILRELAMRLPHLPASTSYTGLVTAVDCLAPVAPPSPSAYYMPSGGLQCVDEDESSKPAPERAMPCARQA